MVEVRILPYYFDCVIYLFHYQLPKQGTSDCRETGGSQAKLEVEAFMKESAGNVDETNVKLLTGADVDAGKTIFQANWQHVR